MKTISITKTSVNDLLPVILAIAAVLLLTLSRAAASHPSSAPLSGGGLNVFVTDSGRIMTSADGLNWRTRDTAGARIRGVTYGNGRYVAVGHGGAIFTSQSGKHWTERRSGTESVLRGVAFGNGLFVAVGPGRTLLSSPDGFRWTRHTTDHYLYSVTFDNCNFIASSKDSEIVLDLGSINTLAAK